MPIRIPNNLPARGVLEGENIFVMTEARAESQQIRPLRIGLLNLMPTKITTETQLSRLLGNTPLQVELFLIQVSSHQPRNTPQEHMIAFYRTFEEIKEEYFDGFIITGAPVEQLPFEQVEYWQELCQIMEWSKTHVHSTLHICWGAQAALYYHFGVEKIPLEEKLFGVFPHRVLYKNPILLRGFDDEFWVPHSRHTTVRWEDVAAIPEIKILAGSEQAGLYAMSTQYGHQLFITGHSEYDADTLKLEYLRDKNAGKSIRVPENYFPNDDETQPPMVTWRGHANLLFSNWLNYIVYQTVPYDVMAVGRGERTDEK